MIFVEPSRRYLRIGAAKEVLELTEEFVHVLELPVHRRKTHVRDFIELAEAIHDTSPDVARRHLALLGVMKLRLDLIHDRVELCGRNGPLLAGLDQAGAKFLAIEVFP